MLGSAGSSVGVAVGASVAGYAPFAGPAAPLVAAVGGIIAAASAIAGALHIGEGCGPTCVQATQIVNQAEPVLKQNVAMFQAGTIDKQTALNNFNQVWMAVQQSCGAVPGAAGINCVGDRQRGGKWDWFSYYYDPIANAPDTVTTYNPIMQVAQTNVSGFPLWMVGGAVLLFAVVAGGNN